MLLASTFSDTDTVTQEEKQLLSDYSVLYSYNLKIMQENKIFLIMKIFTDESVSYIIGQISSLKYPLIKLKIIRCKSIIK